MPYRGHKDVFPAAKQKFPIGGSTIAMPPCPLEEDRQR